MAVCQPSHDFADHGSVGSQELSEKSQAGAVRSMSQGLIYAADVHQPRLDLCLRFDL